MAITNVGFPGTVTSAGWALLEDYLGGGEKIASGFTGTAVANQTRQVSWAAGSAYAEGVYSTSDAAVVTTHAAPSGTSTRWDTVVLRRDWAYDTGTTDDYGNKIVGRTQVVVVPGGSTEAIAAGLKNNPGVEHDQPIGLVKLVGGQTAPQAIRNLTTPPRHDLVVHTYSVVSGTEDAANVTGDGETWPSGGSASVYVPRWAKTVNIVALWHGVNTQGGNSSGNVRVLFDNEYTQRNNYSAAASDQNRIVIGCADELTVDTSARGRVVSVRPIAAVETDSAHPVLMDAASSWSVFLDFKG